MKHFARIIMEKQEVLTENINNYVFPNSVIYESEQGATVIHIPLKRNLNEHEADNFASKLSEFFFNEGYNDFDIEISTDYKGVIDEETYDGNDFYEEYGVLGYTEDILDEAEYRGRKVKLNKPMRGDVKKFKVYVKDPKTGNIKKVNFGDPNMRIRKNDPARRRSFRARHNCKNPGPKTKARYWSCKKW